MFIIKLTQTGGFEEWRGMISWYGGSLLPAMDALPEHMRDRAQRYPTREEAEQEAARVRRARSRFAVEVVEA